MSDKAYKLPKRAPTPMTTGYRPELDVTELLDPQTANYYQSLIGVLRWTVEIGRIDITTEVSMLAACMAMPRKGHLFAVFRVFAYLKNKHNARMVYDPSYPKIDHTKFKDKEEWSNFYGNVKEAIPTNAPKPRGKHVILRVYVDSDHAGDPPAHGRGPGRPAAGRGRRRCGPVVRPRRDVSGAGRGGRRPRPRAGRGLAPAAGGCRGPA